MVPSLKMLPTSTPRSVRSGAPAVRAPVAVVGRDDVGDEIRLPVATDVGVEEVPSLLVGPGHEVGRAHHELVGDDLASFEPDRRGVARRRRRSWRSPRASSAAARPRRGGWRAWPRSVPCRPARRRRRGARRARRPRPAARRRGTRSSPSWPCPPRAAPPAPRSWRRAASRPGGPPAPARASPAPCARWPPAGSGRSHRRRKARGCPRRAGVRYMNSCAALPPIMPTSAPTAITGSPQRAKILKYAS